MVSFELIKALDSFLNSTAFEGNITDWNELISLSKKHGKAFKRNKINVLTRDILLKNINSIIIFQNGELNIKFK